MSTIGSQTSTSPATKYNRLTGTIGGGLGGYALGTAVTPCWHGEF